MFSRFETFLVLELLTQYFFSPSVSSFYLNVPTTPLIIDVDSVAIINSFIFLQLQSRTKQSKDFDSLKEHYMDEGKVDDYQLIY